MLAQVNSHLPQSLETRVLAGRACNEDAVVVAVPAGKALVQTVDILSPNVDDAFTFGAIAAANALSDVYAMGGVPWSAMSIACFPDRLAEEEPGELAAILQGALSKMTEASCVSAGGHTVRDNDMKFGLAVTGIVDPEHIARNSGLVPGMRLLLTKPVGSGLLVNGVKGRWDQWEQSEALVKSWCSHLNAHAGEAIRAFSLPAATDITGFGLGGHTLEMAQASHVSVHLRASGVPVMGSALEYASDGLVPAGSIRNRKFYACRTQWDREKDEDLENLIFDTQTSGGLLLGVPQEKVTDVQAFLAEKGEMAAVVGTVVRDDGIPLHIV